MYIEGGMYTERGMYIEGGMYSFLQKKCNHIIRCLNKIAEFQMGKLIKEKEY